MGLHQIVSERVRESEYTLPIVASGLLGVATAVASKVEVQVGRDCVYRPVVNDAGLNSSTDRVPRAIRGSGHTKTGHCQPQLNRRR